MSTLENRIEEILGNCSMGHMAFIMKEIDKEQKILSPPLHWFAELMEGDLRKNDFKGGWLDGELDYYRAKALSHMVGLEGIGSLKFKSLLSKKNAIKHCFKSANYCMMLAHNLIEEIRKEMGEEIDEESCTF